jgi:hypothetical protein
MLNVAALVLAAVLVSPDDSFVLVHDGGKCITNGAPTNVKAVKNRFSGSYFWFTRGGEEYIVRDAAAIQRVRELHAPLFDREMAGPAGEQFEIFQQQMKIMREQMTIGLEPREGEDPSVRLRRAQLKDEQNRLARRQNELARETNRIARALNAVPPEKINAEISRTLAVFANELLRSGAARKVN